MTRMSELKRSRLLNFLSKPRLEHEIAEHFNVPISLANYHLREAIKSGQVLASERPVFRTLKDSNGRLRHIGGFVYVFKKSPISSDSRAKFHVRKADSSGKSGGAAFSIKFLSNVHESAGRNLLPDSLTGLTFEKLANPPINTHLLKARAHLAQEPDVPSTKIEQARQRTIEQLLRHSTRSPQEEATSLSYSEEIHLFQALLNEPLPYLELHERFSVSKQTMRRLVKNGLLMELWGPRAIGVRFKLTNNGRTHLKKLEAAAKYELKLERKPFIRLKHRIST